MRRFLHKVVGVGESHMTDKIDDAEKNDSNFRAMLKNIEFWALLTACVGLGGYTVYDKLIRDPHADLIDRHKLMGLDLTTQGGLLVVSSDNDLSVSIDSMNSRYILNVKFDGYDIETADDTYRENKRDTVIVGFHDAFKTTVRNVLDTNKVAPTYLDTVQYDFPLLEKDGPFIDPRKKPSFLQRLGF